MQKMKFSKDMYYDDQNVPLYQAGKVYEVEDSMVARWLKRGGEIVEESKGVVQAAIEKVEHAVETVVDAVTGGPKEPVEPADEKVEDGVKPEPPPKAGNKQATKRR